MRIRVENVLGGGPTERVTFRLGVRTTTMSLARRQEEYSWATQLSAILMMAGEFYVKYQRIGQ